MTGMVVDLFAGPGGWDVAAQQLGIDPLGVEMDDAARATRKAAGLTTSFGRDVAKMDLATWSDVTGIIASPPCQTFSMAGKGAGRAALDQVLLGIKRLCVEGRIPYEEYDDARTGLVLEPLRYALELEPEWLAWEQVPTVQPVWDACAEVLRQDGYSVWTGHLHAETYGVPQTRKRSVLIASRSREMSKPPVTHSRFYPRSPAKLDAGVAKWVSMAEALGWHPSDRVISNYGTGGDPRNRGERTADLPSATVTSKIDRNVVLRSPQSIAGGERAYRDASQPAVTVTSNFSRAMWQTSGMLSAGGNNTAGQILRTPEMPSATLTGKGTAYWQPVARDAVEGGKPGYEPGWPHRRPAPTILAGHNRSTSELPNGSSKGAVRVTVEEAACLQSFPDGYPWQGTRTKQFQQVGNAIPPLLALHVLSHVTGTAMPTTFIADATGETS